MLIDNEKTISDYTESEFIALLSNFFENKYGLNTKDFGKFIDVLQLHVVKITQHPLGNGLIFNTPDEIECSPLGIFKEIKSWRAFHDLELFKDSN
ncbi:bacteriocin immunity protein [Citrobacter europaeus]|uniref:bacteriocin immunity protein n=1 Tax=Citrobacter europaeus TaxID=1914243 RepID=UPI000537E7B8|nr:bacteriocin immunity protein [Citrobacter europaeus]AUT97972.1 bacteriocin immunity protein [Citrobacter freundii]ROW38172.1 bacteriocin immunity protein [Citrobacter europaeus]